MSILYLPNTLCNEILECKLYIDSNSQALARYLISDYTMYDDSYQLNNYDYNYYLIVDKKQDYELFTAICILLDYKIDKRKKFFIGIGYDNNDNYIHTIEILNNKKEYDYHRKIDEKTQQEYFLSEGDI